MVARAAAAGAAVVVDGARRGRVVLVVAVPVDARAAGGGLEREAAVGGHLHQLGARDGENQQEGGEDAQVAHGEALHDAIVAVVLRSVNRERPERENPHRQAGAG